MAASLDTIEARLIALEQQLLRRFDENDRDHAELKEQVAGIDECVRDHEREIAVLQQQSNSRTGALLTMQLITGAIAAWLGMRQ